jgi:hypothetical protein
MRRAATIFYTLLLSAVLGLCIYPQLAGHALAAVPNSQPGNYPATHARIQQKNNDNTLVVNTSSETTSPNPYDQRNRGTLARLPQPQAELPLLGLVGLGSLVAGLIMRR